MTQNEHVLKHISWSYKSTHRLLFSFHAFTSRSTVENGTCFCKADNLKPHISSGGHEYPVCPLFRFHVYYCSLLLLGFTALFNILGHQRRFRHRAWKVRQILLRVSNFGLRFFYVPQIYDTWPTALVPFQGKSYSGFLRSEKSIDPGRVWTLEPQIHLHVW